MIRNFLIALSFLLVLSCQNSSIPAVMDPVLKVEYGSKGCNFIENPTYIVNKDYVVYQDYCTHMVIYPDLASFSIKKNKESAFAFDKNGMYVKGQFIKIDTSGFTFLGMNKEMDFLWKTKSKVFKNLTELKDVDVATFQANPSEAFILGDDIQYYKDKNSIYYFDKKIAGSDGATANTNPNDFCHDKNYIYSNGKVACFDKEFYQYVNYDFAKTKKYVFYRGRIVEGMNPDSLIALSGSYARYKNDIYYQGLKTQMQLDKSSKIKVWTSNNQDNYITDEKSVFNSGKEIYKKIDISSFGFFNKSYCFYDKNGIYEIEYDQELKKDKIEKLPFNYTEKVSSKNTSYNYITGIVFYRNQAYATRTKSYYEDLSKKQIALAKAQKTDIDDFDGSNKVVIDYNFSKMYDRIYFNDKKTGFDAETFVSIDPQMKYYKDKNVVLYYEDIKGHEIKKLNDVDVKSARTLNIFLIDKNYLYCRNVKIIKSTEIELLAGFSGYRGGFCGNDSTPISDFYLFKNSEGFWLVKISDDISYRFLGKVFDRKWDPVFETIDLAKKYGSPRITIPQKPIPAEKMMLENRVYNTSEVDNLPQYPGGIKKFYAFLKKNYVVPEAIIKDQTKASAVYASFIIEKDGSLSDIKILYDFGYGSGKELLRVLKLCPNWMPVIKDGNPVRCLYSLPYHIH